MRLDHGERRDFPRMTVECPMTLRSAGTELAATCLDLSGAGMRFRVAEVLSEGAQMDATLSPPAGAGEPLAARIEVLRSQPDGQGGQEVSARILEILR